MGESQEPGLPPRGMGSGRSSNNLSGSCSVTVRNLDHTVTIHDLKHLFSKIGVVVQARVSEAGGQGKVVFASKREAFHAVQRYHRHPWKGGRPMNVACR